jgi:anti-sigma factor ChrR (cupin superfamily)
MHRDPRSGLYTALLRLSPGALVPGRRHVAVEEIYVVSGVATLDGHDLEAGDYLRAEADSVHPSMTTKNGCTLFVVSSDHDEILED